MGSGAVSKPLAVAENIHSSSASELEQFLVKLLEAGQKVKEEGEEDENGMANFIIDEAGVQKAVDERVYGQSSLEPIGKELQSGDTKLFKGTWLLAWAKTGKKLPRRQEMPAEAFWTADKLLPKLSGGPKGAHNIDSRKVRITSLSYCWLCPQNPDPEGEQLQTIAAAVDLRLNHQPPLVQRNKEEDRRFPMGQQDLDGGVRTCALEDLAMFFDWSSMYQQERAPEEGAAFKRSLCSVNLWYAHVECQIWKLSKLPSSAASVLAYSQRGWPYFEESISGLLHAQSNFIDLGVLVENFEAFGDWQALVESTRKLKPPVVPARFVKNLAAKAFTNKADHAFVAQKYAQTFAEVMGSATELNFSKQEWGPEEFSDLADSLLWAPSLARLDVGDNKPGVDGAYALATVLPRCLKLRALFVDGNKIGDKGMAAFIDVLPQMRPNGKFSCSRCDLSPEGGAQLRKAYDDAGHKGILQGDYCRKEQ